MVVVLLFIATPQLLAQRIYLVSVGVADYPGSDMDLMLTVDDARDFNDLYRTNSSVNSVILLNSQATRVNVLSAMYKHFIKATEEDIVVLFYSGHGYRGGFVGYDDYISYDEIKDVMSKVECKNKMIFADACYSGTIRKGSRSNTTASSNSLANYNILLFLSSRDGEVSYESQYMDNGLFTTALLKGLKGSADKDRDRTITALELFLYVSGEVKDLSDDEQHPVMWGKFNKNMPVMVW